MKTLWIAGLLGTSLVLGLNGCNKEGSGYVPRPAPKVAELKLAAGDDRSLFPLVEGNQWVYTSSIGIQAASGSGKRDNELTFSIRTVTDTANGKKALIEISTGGKITERQYWLVNDKGIFQLSAGEKAEQFTPPQLAVPFPAETNREFKWQGTGLLPGGGSGPSVSAGKVLGTQEVDTELGRMSAVAVETEQTWTAKGKQNHASSTVWWTPKIGIVRFYQEIVTPDVQATQTLRLKSKTVKD